MTTTQPRIAIIGAGPAGLTLGVLLHNRGIPFEIFELRQKPTEEELAKPSGSLDLHDESGLAAINECGLHEQFLSLIGECSEDLIIADKDGNTVYSDHGEGANRPEISRHALTKLLLSSIPPQAINWGHGLVSVAKSTTAKYHPVVLDFGPNGKHDFDLVVGADGAWSKVRSMLTGVKPTYAGVQVITATIHHVEERYSHIAELIGRGTFNALAMRHGVASQRGSKGSARIYIFVSTPDEHFATTYTLSGQTAAEAKHKLLKDKALLGEWGSKMKELVTIACNEETAENPNAGIDIKPLYTLPVENSWDHSSGATVIGDAAHLMCPWAGEGVNLAMWDSLDLSRIITQAYKAGGQDGISFQRTLDPLLSNFEVEMLSRSKEKAEEVFRNGQVMFGEDGAAAMAHLMQNYGAPEQ